LAFLIFLADEKAEVCEICRLSSYCLTLRLKAPKDMAVFYSTSILKTKRAERYVLYETIGDHTENMPRFLRESRRPHRAGSLTCDGSEKRNPSGDSFQELGPEGQGPGPGTPKRDLARGRERASRLTSIKLGPWATLEQHGALAFWRRSERRH
jgi:hypothetical protein